MLSRLPFRAVARRTLAQATATRASASSLACVARHVSGGGQQRGHDQTAQDTGFRQESGAFRSGIIQAVRDLAKEQSEARANNGGETGEAIQRTLNAAAEEVLRRQREAFLESTRKNVAGTPAQASSEATRAADEKGDFEMPVRGEDVAALHGHTFRDQRPLDPDETLENKRRRLVYQSRYRGMVEMDLIFGHFARCKLETLDRAQLDEYDTLLKQLDNELFRWLVMDQPAPEDIAALKCFQTVKAFVAQEREQLLGHY